MSSKRLEILKASLVKKEQRFNDSLNNHIDTVKQANGQPLNDKRNGQATLNKWERQNEALRNQQKGIEITKEAIEREEWKIKHVEAVSSELPKPILDLIESKTITQWRKFPNMFFVVGVDKARIIWDKKKQNIACSYLKAIPTQEQYSLFAKVYNQLRAELTK